MGGKYIYLFICLLNTMFCMSNIESKGPPCDMKGTALLLALRFNGPARTGVNVGLLRTKEFRGLTSPTLARSLTLLDFEHLFSFMLVLTSEIKSAPHSTNVSDGTITVSCGDDDLVSSITTWLLITESYKLNYKDS